MIALENYVRASGEPCFTRAQQLSRLHPTKLLDQPHLIEEFIKLVSEECKFVDNWQADKIKPSTMIIYGKGTFLSISLMTEGGWCVARINY